MNQKKSNKVLTAIAASVVLFFIALPSYGFIWENGSGKGYCEESTESGCESSGAIARVSSSQIGIEGYIELGGGYYLESYSSVLNLLQRIEMSNHEEINPDEIRQISSNAVGQLISTTSVYSAIISIAENTPYNPVIIDKLGAFDYVAFQENTGLCKETFQNVQVYLSKGDITGNFKMVYEELLKLEAQLFEIDSEIQAGRLPSVKALWDLNERYSNILRYGQYVSRVFSAL